MRRKRKKVVGQLGYYHLMSRTVNGEALFGDHEKEVLRKMIWKIADFSGLKVITYAIMNNHFHILAEVPAEREVSDAELVRRFRVLYPVPTPWQPMRPDVLEEHLENNTPEGKEMRRLLTRRMHDISWFMKTLKHRFSHWYNRTKDRFGPLWSDRFKSVLVEGDRWALKIVAAYIDLNPVRAGIVSDPKDYRFCGYAEALGGRRVAKEGNAVISRSLAGYRQTLFGVGSDGMKKRAVIDRESALRVLRDEKGEIGLVEMLRCRLRYFSDGVVLGSVEFVANQLEEEENPPVRKRNPLRMKGNGWRGLAVGSPMKSRLFS